MILLRQKKKFDSISANLIVSNSKYRKDFNWNPPFTVDLGLKKSFTKKKVNQNFHYFVSY